MARGIGKAASPDREHPRGDAATHSPVSSSANVLVRQRA
jgi:hypothetical protein